MSDSIDADVSGLLTIFNETYDKISTQGMKHSLGQEGIPATAKRISIVAAWIDGASREIGVIDKVGKIHPFAKVNGKGFVETVGNFGADDMEAFLRKTGDRVAKTTPCIGEGSMYHFSSRGRAKVF